MCCFGPEVVLHVNTASGRIAVGPCAVFMGGLLSGDPFTLFGDA